MEKFKIKRYYRVNYFVDGVLEHKYFSNCVQAFEFASENALHSVEVFKDVYEVHND